MISLLEDRGAVEPSVFLADFRTAPKWENVIRSRWQEFNSFARYFLSNDHRYGLSFSPLTHFARSVCASTLTAYPDPDPETTTIDGTIFKGNSTVFATTHDAASGEYTTDTSTTFAMYWHRTAGNNYYIMRVVALFNTSALTSAATISSATFVVIVSQNSDVRSDVDSWGVYSSAPASNTALSVNDYDKTNFGTTVYSNTIAFSAVGNLNATNTYTLNASGLAAISKTSITKFGMRTVGDAGNSNTISSSNSGFIGGYYAADNSGTSSDPKLTVTYSTFLYPQIERTMPRGAARGILRP